MAEFNLPGSSFSELKKIILAYANAKPGTSLSEVATLAGLHKTIVSRNNKFLSEISVIEGGNSKVATELGKRLGRAIEHQQVEDECGSWSDAIKTNEPLASIMTTVRIKGGMSEEELAKHILYVSGQSNSSANKTGARCVQDVLVAGRLLNEADGKFEVAKPESEKNTNSETTSSTVTPSVSEHETLEINKVSTGTECKVNGKRSASISINIQLQLPETKDAEVYEKIFKALSDNFGLS